MALIQSIYHATQLRRDGYVAVASYNRMVRKEAMRHKLAIASFIASPRLKRKNSKPIGTVVARAENFTIPVKAIEQAQSIGTRQLLKCKKCGASHKHIIGLPKGNCQCGTQL